MHEHYRVSRKEEYKLNWHRPEQSRTAYIRLGLLFVCAYENANFLARK